MCGDSGRRRSVVNVIQTILRKSGHNLSKPIAQHSVACHTQWVLCFLFKNKTKKQQNKNNQKRYDQYAQWHLNKYNIKRETLAMCPVLMSQNSLYHPYSMYNSSGATASYTLEEVINSKQIGKVTNLLECARRVASAHSNIRIRVQFADGGAAIVVCDQQFISAHRKKTGDGKNIVILGGGEGGGRLVCFFSQWSLFPREKIEESDLSCELACDIAFEECQLRTSDIQWFGLYDCFPVCLIRAIEAVGLAPRGKGANYIRHNYEQLVQLQKKNNFSRLPEDVMNQFVHQFPINTHGGLLAFGTFAFCFSLSIASNIFNYILQKRQNKSWIVFFILQTIDDF
ncbi:nonspecific lipid-transfer protein [Reticulomyxa filosa]|uniref:Nonspecific lipid-transfer protein n=1 Tax=Reticulomyxa filosa TaxID=46433 RepID=X6PB97_RETFI|nr:nonspecific lipid-transfer protein [Reticulomyxa filosa]|eukprot:ETO35825.1 nonspecific lipid-transfer protein [Reticulomyxa filosa]